MGVDRHAHLLSYYVDIFRLAGNVAGPQSCRALLILLLWARLLVMILVLIVAFACALEVDGVGWGFDPFS